MSSQEEQIQGEQEQKPDQSYQEQIGQEKERQQKQSLKEQRLREENSKKKDQVSKKIMKLKQFHKISAFQTQSFIIIPKFVNFIRVNFNLKKKEL